MAEYNQDQSGLRSELDEPRRTTENEVENTGFGGDSGVGEQEPPHHKIHSDDEPLPKPSNGTFDDEGDAPEEPREEQVLPSGTGGGYGGESAPQGTEKYQDFRSDEPRDPVDETPDSQSRSFGEGKQSGGYSDPSEAFPGAPVDRKFDEPGYGQDAQTPEPLDTGVAPESPTPKKEGLVQKLKDKLPGHHKTSTPESVDDVDSPTETGTPKKGLITKIKEKLPGHHASTTPTIE